jgi:hypothetical protein
MADRLWSLAVRSQWNNRCAVCGAGKVDAHHLVPRQHEETRYDLRNGIALCSHCHQFDPDLSPHLNAAGWLGWLQRHHWDMWSWYCANSRPIFTGVKNAAHYCEKIRRLRPQVAESAFTKTCGVRFAKWLEG